MKKGTISAAGAKILIQNYSNLTLEDVILEGSENNTYVLSNNFGEIHLKGNTQILAKGDGVAFDLWYGMNGKGLYDDGVSVYIDSPDVVIQGPIEFGAASRATIGNWLANTHLYVIASHPGIEDFQVIGAGKGAGTQFVWVQIAISGVPYYELRRASDVSDGDETL